MWFGYDRAMDQQRLLAGGLGLVGAFAMPGPARIVAMGWLGPRPSLVVLLILAAVAFTVIVGFGLGAWKLLTKQWPPREATGLLILFVGARVILDVVRMMGLWIL